MSSLEENLKEILGYFENYADHEEYHVGSDCTDDWDEEQSIEAIKQAFIDGGWVQVPQVEVVTRYEAGKKPEVYMVNGIELMTGPEWLARFDEEKTKVFREQREEDMHQRESVAGLYRIAARRASGVDHE